MKIEMKLLLKKFDNSLERKLQKFCDICKELGYENNSSFKSMKLDWILEVGEFWCALKNDEIIAVSGFHPLPEIHPKAWRILFRGCELKSSDTFVGLGKAHWNSIGFREFIPIFIKRCPSEMLIITTNIDHDHSNGRSSKTHRAMKLMENQRLLINLGEKILYEKFQSIWQLNIEEYLNRRNKLNNIYCDIGE